MKRKHKEKPAAKSRKAARRTKVLPIETGLPGKIPHKPPRPCPCPWCGRPVMLVKGFQIEAKSKRCPSCGFEGFVDENLVDCPQLIDGRPCKGTLVPREMFAVCEQTDAEFKVMGDLCPICQQNHLKLVKKWLTCEECHQDIETACTSCPKCT